MLNSLLGKDWEANSLIPGCQSAAWECSLRARLVSTVSVLNKKKNNKQQQKTPANAEKFKKETK